MDAYLAAFALHSGFQMVTSDKAFRQFIGLKTLILKSETP
jgi:predicted nucleic acid-binding protein